MRKECMMSILVTVLNRGSLSLGISPFLQLSCHYQMHPSSLWLHKIRHLVERKTSQSQLMKKWPNRVGTLSLLSFPLALQRILHSLSKVQRETLCQSWTKGCHQMSAYDCLQSVFKKNLPCDLEQK